MFDLEKRLENARQGYRRHKDYVDMGELAALEEELTTLKMENNIAIKKNPLIALIDRIVGRIKKNRVNRKTYIKLALCLGWIVGAHRFYAGHKILGSLYLLFFWTGIPFAMTIADLMIALPMEADKEGYIEI